MLFAYYAFGLIAFYVSIIIHELGHAVFGRLAGFSIGSVGLGTARPFYVTSLGKTRVYLALVKPLQGLTFAFHPEIIPSRGAWAGLIAGGAEFNALAALISFGFWYASTWENYFWLICLGVNSFFAAINLIPFLISLGPHKIPNDGLLILQTLREGMPARDARMMVPSVEAFRGLWRSVGDHTSLLVSLDAAGGFCLQIRDIDRARAYFDEADAIAELGHPSARLVHELSRASLAMASQRFDESAQAITRAESFLPGKNSEAGEWLISLVRASLRLERGDISGASAEGARLASDPFGARHPSLAAAAVSLQIHAERDGADVAEVDRLASLYSRLRENRPSSGEQMTTFSTLGRFWTKVGEGARARAAYRQALDAITMIASGIAAADDRARFLELHGAALNEIRDRFADTEDAGDISRRINALRVPMDDQAAQEFESWAQREKRQFRWASRIFLFNLLVSLTAIGRIASGTRGDRNLLPIVMVAFMLMACNLISVFVFLTRFIQNRLRPRSTTNWSLVPLISPTVVWLAIMVFTFLFVIGIL